AGWPRPPRAPQGPGADDGRRSTGMDACPARPGGIPSRARPRPPPGARIRALGLLRMGEALAPADRGGRDRAATLPPLGGGRAPLVRVLRDDRGPYLLPRAARGRGPRRSSRDGRRGG